MVFTKSVFGSSPSANSRSIDCVLQNAFDSNRNHYAGRVEKEIRQVEELVPVRLKILLVCQSIFGGANCELDRSLYY